MSTELRTRRLLLNINPSKKTSLPRNSMPCEPLVMMRPSSLRHLRGCGLWKGILTHHVQGLDGSLLGQGSGSFFLVSFPSLPTILFSDQTTCLEAIVSKALLSLVFCLHYLLWLCSAMLTRERCLLSCWSPHEIRRHLRMSR